MESIIVTLETVVGIVVAVIGYLLARKDAAQESLISELFRKHEEDAFRLQALELRIASSHYQKPEVDRLMDKFKDFLDEKFMSLESMLKEKQK